MNLHGIAAGAIGAVNPHEVVSFRASTGYTVAADRKQIPSYAAPVDVPAQVQPMTYKDLMQVDGLNLNGTKRSIYLYGGADGIVRVSQKGGDLIVIASGRNAGVWLTAIVLEQWPDWVKIACTLQDGS